MEWNEGNPLMHKSVLSSDGSSYFTLRPLPAKDHHHPSSQHQSVGDFSSIMVDGFWIDKHTAVDGPIATGLVPRGNCYTKHRSRGPTRGWCQPSHSDVATTQVYTHLTSDHVRKEYDKSHPRAA